MTDNIKNTKIVQRNLRGALASKSAIIKQYFDKNAVDWAAFMETFADETMQDTILGYKGYHRQRDHGSQKRGGVAVKWIIATDANAHKDLWDSFVNENDRGNTIVDYMIDQGLVCQNDSEKPTRSAKLSGDIKHSSPDLTLTKGMDVHNWDTEADELSDHNWVTYGTHDITSGQPRKMKFWNMAKAKWEKYTEYVDRVLEGMTKGNGNDHNDSPQEAPRRYADILKSRNSEISHALKHTGLAPRRYRVPETKYDTTRRPHDAPHDRVPETKHDRSSPAHTIGTLTDLMLKAMKAAVPKGSHKERVPLWTPAMTEAQKFSKEADLKHRNNPTRETLEASKKATADMHKTNKKERRRIFWENFNEHQGKKDMWRLKAPV